MFSGYRTFKRKNPCGETETRVRKVNKAVCVTEMLRDANSLVEQFNSLLRDISEIQLKIKTRDEQSRLKEDLCDNEELHRTEFEKHEVFIGFVKDTVSYMEFLQNSLSLVDKAKHFCSNDRADIINEADKQLRRAQAFKIGEDLQNIEAELNGVKNDAAEVNDLIITQMEAYYTMANSVMKTFINYYNHSANQQFSKSLDSFLQDMPHLMQFASPWLNDTKQEKTAKEHIEEAIALRNDSNNLSVINNYRPS